MRFKDLVDISKHPLNQKKRKNNIFRYLKFGLVSKLMKYPFIYSFIGDVQLIIKQGLTSSMLQYYTGLYDFEEMSFLLHFLQEDDFFLDVGANNGVYTLLASGYRKANSISFEASKDEMENLKNNISLNNLWSKVTLHNIAVSDKIDKVKFTINQGAVNHVLYNSDNDDTFIEVDTNTIDNCTKNIDPVLLKIDIEGYELNALKGAKNLLQNQSLKAIIIELNGLASKYDINESEVVSILDENGFLPYAYNPFKRKLIEFKQEKGEKNIIYIRDIDFVNQRLTKSSGFKIKDYTF